MHRKLAVAALIASTVFVSGCAADQSDRQAEVADRGRSVMPFDLDKTTHRFLPQSEGLLQEVVADHPDAGQITLVREHLAQEAERFRRGDFADPARIHGRDMPGLAALSAGAAKITISYAERGDGAALTFRTADSTLVQALHAWGEAQISDHGKHVEHGTQPN